MSRSKFAIITRRLPPVPCGIGDHSVCLANALKAMNHEVYLISGEGDAGIKVATCDWQAASLRRLFEILEELQPDHVVLQFTPHMYLTTHDNSAADLVEFWRACGNKWQTSLIVHETYFFAWWYPPAWIGGLRERSMLQKLVNCSRNTFSASQPLVDEMRGWEQDKRISVLPIGSNIPCVPASTESLRQQHGVAPGDVVLTLFSGGNSLKWLRGHVNAVNRLLNMHGISHHWLLLGGVPEKWFKLSSPVISPGWLSEEDISAWLQATDIFLMPHFAGLCAKRGTLMTAMEHGLPVVGTRSGMTDRFWSEVAGVVLVPRWSAKSFAEAVLQLASDKSKSAQYGNSNYNYFARNFTWERVSRKFLEELGRS